MNDESLSKKNHWHAGPLSRAGQSVTSLPHQKHHTTRQELKSFLSKLASPIRPRHRGWSPRSGSAYYAKTSVVRLGALLLNGHSLHASAMAFNCAPEPPLLLVSNCEYGHVREAKSISGSTKDTLCVFFSGNGKHISSFHGAAAGSSRLTGPASPALQMSQHIPACLGSSSSTSAAARYWCLCLQAHMLTQSS